MNKIEILGEVIRTRKTEKVLGDPEAPVRYSAAQLKQGDEIVKRSIKDSGWAPFHYNRRQDGLAEPWRAWWMNQAECLSLCKKLPKLIPDMKPGNKMPALLSGCGSLTLFTWLPEEQSDPTDPKIQRINREHLAATSSAVQNFLLLLTAHGIANYWASGTLIQNHLFPELGIPGDQILAAAIFAHYPNPDGSVEVIAGKQREHRCSEAKWLCDVQTVDSE